MNELIDLENHMKWFGSKLYRYEDPITEALILEDYENMMFNNPFRDLDLIDWFE